MICPDADEASATGCGRRLCAAVDKLAIQAGDKRCSISVGVAQRTREMGSPKDLVNAADRHLYQAKRDGRGRVI